MILALRVRLVSGTHATSKWEGVIEVESTSTLEDLHLAIQDALSFDNDHPYHFFSARTERSRQRIGYDNESGSDYEKTIESLFPLPKGLSLYYLFDFGDCWIFSVTKAKPSLVPASPLLTYPRLAHEDGEKPDQYPSTEEW